MISNICVELYLHSEQHLSVEIFFIPVWLKEKEKNHSEQLTTNKQTKYLSVCSMLTYPTYLQYEE